MIVGVGNDILEVSRMRRELSRRDGGFRDQVFTADEIGYCQRQRYPARHFAARFAAKEAALKALRSGVKRWAAWREIEVGHGPDGEPRLIFHGAVKRMATRRRVRRAWVSLAHTQRVASASVILEA